MHPIRVITNHVNLEYFATTKLPTRCQAWWSKFLSSFHYDVYYWPGCLSGKLDLLTHWSDVYPRGGGSAYALTNPQNIQQLFKDGQLLESLRATYVLELDIRPADAHVQICATILEVDSMHEDIAGLAIDEFARDQLADLSAPWTLSSSGLLL